jgi:para-nitrobenzyl esterase
MNRRTFIQRAGLSAAAVPFITTQSSSPQPADTETGIVAAANYAVVDTSAGKIRGYSRNGIYTFKGVPYAQSTAGENRFQPAIRLSPWTGIKNALVYGPVCPQAPNKGWRMEEYAFLFQWSDGIQDEDCLRINVWTPNIQDNQKRPVMFWIHGGAFFSGSSQEHPSYDGENLSRAGDVVVVSINHRLNVFGFLDLSDYGSRYEASGNVGMLDIVAALEWVRDNISNFGGDPDNITIFGQSGGAAKVTTLMAMPDAKGLFHKAISQSSSTLRVATKEYAVALSKKVLAELSITDSNLSDLHKLPFRTISDAAIAAEKKLVTPKPPEVGRNGWQPVVDGKIIPGHPFSSESLAHSSSVPMIIGSNRHEWSASIGDPEMESLTEDGLRKKLQEKYGERHEALYKVIRQVHPAVRPVEILSFLNPYNPMAFRQSEIKSSQKTAPVYLYMFQWKTPVLDGRPRAFHCSEIPFVFHNTDRAENMTGGGADALALSKQLSMAWINFARTGNPNGKGITNWPPFTAKGETMMIDHQWSVALDPDGEFRKILETLF